MRVQFEKVTTPPHASFSCREFKVRSFEYPWHFHPECELTLIVESSGRRFVGDHIGPFETGDLVLLGPNLPHFYFNDSPSTYRRAHSIVVQFLEDFAGADFLKIPEMQAVVRLLARSRRGLQVRGKLRTRMARRMQELSPMPIGLPRTLALLAMLEEIAHARGPGELRPLASPRFSPLLDGGDAERIGKVCAYVNERFTEPLHQPDAARMANLTPAAFSRYFKAKTGKTFVEFVNEIRVGHACKLLLEGTRTSTEICYACGFENISNFNRRFRAITGCSPSEYTRAARV